MTLRKDSQTRRTEFLSLKSQEEIDAEEFRPIRWALLRRPRLAIKAVVLTISVVLGYVSVDAALNSFIVDDLLIGPLSVPHVTQEILPPLASDS